MDQKTRSLIVGAIAIVILAAVAGAYVYLTKFSQNAPKVTNEVRPTALSQLPVASPGPSNSNNTNTMPAIGNSGASTKIFSGDGFNFQFPANWALLTCSNSQNFEFDPVNRGDLSGVVCDRAIKPVTFLVVDQVSCPGQTTKLGNNQVTRSKATAENGDIGYRWCLKLADGKGLDITHRVSASGGRATSKQDFSTQIEQIISSIRLGSGGS